MDEQLTIRQATAADIPVIVAQRIGMFEDMKGGPINRDWIEPFKGWMERQLASGAYHGWLAQTADGRVVAGVGLMVLDWPPGPLDPQPYRGYLLNVFTDPDYRRRGLAKHLIQAALDWCREQRIRVVGLHASEKGKPLYAAMGFEPTNEMRLKTDLS
jgi:GNAT superfamily N-acetyltransferase